MPELPEVETVARQLRSILVGKTVNKVNIMYERVVDNNISNIVPFSIKSVSRRGKWIIIELTNKKHLLTHLRMTGHFHHVKDPLETKHERFLAATFHLNDNTSLTHNSIRRFGSIQLLTKHQLKNKLSKQGYFAGFLSSNPSF